MKLRFTTPARIDLIEIQDYIARLPAAVSIRQHRGVVVRMSGRPSQIDRIGPRPGRRGAEESKFHATSGRFCLPVSSRRSRSSAAQRDMRDALIASRA